jgi:DNA gyrase/topoisomerase IV subunit A
MILRCTSPSEPLTISRSVNQIEKRTQVSSAQSHTRISKGSQAGRMSSGSSVKLQKNDAAKKGRLYTRFGNVVAIDVKQWAMYQMFL